MKITRLVVLSWLLLVSTSVAAPWLDRAREAPLQVLARCQSRSSHWEGGAIFSDSEVAVLRVVRGQPSAGFTVRQRGGEVDGIGQKVGHGRALLEPGQTYLLFLVPDELGHLSPVSTGVNLVLDLPDLGPSIAGAPLEEVLSSLGGAD